MRAYAPQLVAQCRRFPAQPSLAEGRGDTQVGGHVDTISVVGAMPLQLCAAHVEQACDEPRKKPHQVLGQIQTS